MLIIHTDNRIDRGQTLRIRRPAYRVDLTSLYPADQQDAFYQNDGMHELIGVSHQSLRLDEQTDPGDPTHAPGATDIIVLDHEVLHPAFGKFWQDPHIGKTIAGSVRNGALLWIGFQSSGFIPDWLSTLVQSRWRVVHAGIPDSIVPVPKTGHPLLEGFPNDATLDWICNESYRVLKRLACVEPFDPSPQPGERGSIAWLELDETRWQVLAYRKGHRQEAALAQIKIGNGLVILDQTLALHGPNIDNPSARRFAGNIRTFMSIAPLVVREDIPGRSFHEVRPPTAPDHAPRQMKTFAGIPFAVYGDENVLSFDGAESELPLHVQVERIYLLGNTLSWPFATGAWFVKATDFTQDYFIGDAAGHIEVRYEDGTTEDLPLIMGWNIFFNQPLVRESAEHWRKPFDDPAARRILTDTLALTPGDGKEASRAWVLALTPQPKKIRSLIFRKPDGKIGVPVYGGITVLTAESSEQIFSLAPCPGNAPECKTVNLPAGFNPDRLLPLQRLLYTSPADFASAPLTVPNDFEGAGIHFHGTREAGALTCIYAHNMANLRSRLHPVEGGPGLSTPVTFGAYRNAMGTWSEGSVDNTVNFWGRDNGRTGMERLALGLHRGTRQEIACFDRHLYCGNPPHMERTVSDWPLLHTWKRQSLAGNTIKVPPENDAHGLIMLYRAAYLRHYPDQEEALWKATDDYAEWVAFAMENLLDPRQPKDTLFTVSECSGFGHWDIYSNYLCYAGLMTAVQLARRLGDDARARRWESYAHRLKNALLQSLTDHSPEHWHHSPFSEWQSFTESLAPLTALPDWLGYDPLESDPAMLEVSRKTYEYLLSDKKWWLRMRMIGYDHALALQAALLLDDNPRSEKLLNTLIHTCYSRNGPEPWIIAEGSVIHEDENTWYRLGMGGNLIHLAETLKVVRLMAGVDDLTPGSIRLMPRIPREWDGVTVENYPIAEACAGAPARLNYTYTLREDTADLTVDISRPLSLSLRLGPFSKQADGFTVTVNGKTVEAERYATPEQQWVWIRNLNGNPLKIHLSSTAKQDNRERTYEEK